MTKHYDILIIDDNIDDVELCQRRLNTNAENIEGDVTFVLRHATNGIDGIQEVKQQLPDCVFLDYSLPGNNGLAVLKQIRDLNTSVPIIFLTGQGNENLAVNLLKSGAQDYIIKSEIFNLDLAKIVLNTREKVLLTAGSHDHRGDALLRILVIDDNEDDRELVRRTLKKAKNNTFDYFEAASGKHVLARINECSPDCILLDYSLPGDNGLQILQSIAEAYPFIPVIIFSGQGSESIAAEAIKKGAVHYLVKSDLEPSLLAKAIVQGIEKKQFEKLIHEKNVEINRHQEKFLEQKSLFDKVVRATGIVVWEYNILDDQLVVDSQISSLLGEPIQGCLPILSWRDRIHPDDIQGFDATWQAYLLDDGGEYEAEYRIQHKNKAYRWIRVTGNISEKRNNDTPSHIIGLYEDISERKIDEQAHNQFHEISVDARLSFSDKIAAVLNLASAYLHMDIGVVSKISGDTYEVLHCTPGTSIKQAEIIARSNTYCYYIFGSSEINAWNDIEASGIALCNYNEDEALNAYIGASLFVNEVPFGSLSFLKKKRRKAAFSHREKVLVRLMAQWISSELAKQQNLEKIQASETFLQLVLDAIPDFIFVKNNALQIVRANPAFLGVFPESQQAPLPGSTAKLASDTEMETFLSNDKAALRNGNSEIEECIQFSDGETKTFHTKRIQFKDPSGESFILGISRDITRRIEADAIQKKLLYKLANSNELNKRMMNSAQHLIISTDANGLVTFFNKAAQKLLGYSEAEIVGKKTPAVWHDIEEVVKRAQELSEEMQTEIAPGFDVFVAKIQDDIYETREWTFITKSGKRIPIQLTVSALQDTNSQITGYLGVIEDISQRKQAEAEVLRSNKELERFAYVASHDLQEPLRMVLSFTQLLEKKYADKLDARGLEYIHYACNGASRMQQLVRDLLAYARIGNEAESAETVELNELKTSITENLLGSINQTQAEIEWQALPPVLADPARIGSVFQNLIGNAIKYRKSNSTPVIKVSVESNADSWVFCISDNGIGMKQDYCEKIFEPFKRLHRKEEYSGTGIGLSICRKTIEELGGKIWAISELDKGSFFYFSLPKLTENNA